MARGSDPIHAPFSRYFIHLGRRGCRPLRLSWALTLDLPEIRRILTFSSSLFNRHSEVLLSDNTSRTEEFKFDGDALIGKIKEIVHAGNVRRIVLKDEDGKTLIDIPLTVGVMGA